MTEKPVAHHFAYRYYNPSGLSATVLRHVGGPWNGQQPHEAIPLYTEAQVDAYTAELRAEVERLREFVSMLERRADAAMLREVAR